MRYFARLLEQLKELVKNHKPGEQLPPPPLLGSVQIRGKRVSYLHMGLGKAGPTIVLVHGFGGFFMDWPRIMSPLSRRYRVYALDLPGWGFSEPNGSTEGLEDDAAVVAEFVRAHQLKNVLLVGISYGAAVAWACASLPGRDRSQLKQLLLLNPMPPYPLRHLKSPIYRAIFMINRLEIVARLTSRLMTKSQYKLVCKENLRHFRLLDSLYLDLGYRVMTQPSIGRNLYLHAKKARTIDWASWEKRLGGVELPVTIMQGLNDRVFTLESALYLQGLIPGAKLIEVKDCGHAMVFDQSRRATAQIARLARTLE